MSNLRQGQYLSQNWYRIQIRIYGLNPDSDLDVCWITSNMLWIHDLIGVSDFAKCRENRLLSGYSNRSANKSPKIPYFAMVREVEK